MLLISLLSYIGTFRFNPKRCKRTPRQHDRIFQWYPYGFKLNITSCIQTFSLRIGWTFYVKHTNFFECFECWKSSPIKSEVNPLHYYRFYYLQKLDNKKETFPVKEVLHTCQIDAPIWINTNVKKFSEKVNVRSINPLLRNAISSQKNNRYDEIANTCWLKYL